MSLEDELRAWKYLDELATENLSKYATTLEQDIQILKDDNLADKKME